MKKNYSKAEAALEKRLKKMEIDYLFKLADISQKVGKPELKQMMEKAAMAAHKHAIQRRAILYYIKQGLKKYHDPSMYESLSLSQEEVEKILLKPDQITNEQWPQLIALKEKMEAAKASSIEKDPEMKDERIVEKEREKHINKRFNVKEKWLPL